MPNINKETRVVNLPVLEIVRAVTRDPALQAEIVSKASRWDLDQIILWCLDRAIENHKTDSQNWEQRSLLATFEGKANSYIAMSNTMVRKARERERRYREVRKMFTKLLNDQL